MLIAPRHTRADRFKLKRRIISDRPDEVRRRRLCQGDCFKRSGDSPQRGHLCGLKRDELLDRVVSHPHLTRGQARQAVEQNGNAGRTATVGPDRPRPPPPPAPPRPPPTPPPPPPPRPPP